MASECARRPRRHRRVRRHLPWTDGQSALLDGDATPSQSGCPSPTACGRRPRGGVTVGGIVCTSNRVRGDSRKILTRMSPYRWRDTGFQPRRIGSAAWKGDIIRRDLWVTGAGRVWASVSSWDLVAKRGRLWIPRGGAPQVLQAPLDGLGLQVVRAGVIEEHGTSAPRASPSGSE